MFSDDQLPVKRDRRMGMGNVQNAATYITVFGIAKSLRAYSMFPQYDALHEFPLGEVLFLVLFVSSIVLLALQRPWSGRKRMNGRQWFRVVFHGLWLLCILSLWLFALKHLGPLRTLVLEAVEVCVVIVIGSVFGWRQRHSSQTRGIFLLAFALALFLWTESSTMDYYSTAVGSSALSWDEGEVQVDDGQAVPVKKMTILFVRLPVPFVAFLAVLLASVLSAFRKNFARKLAIDVGGAKRLFSMSVAIACCVMAPTFLYDYFTNASVAGVIKPHTTLGGVCFSGFLLLVLPYYTDFIANMHLTSQQISTWGYPISILAALLVNVFSLGEALDTVLLAIAALIYIATLTSSRHAAGSSVLDGDVFGQNLPLYQYSASASATSITWTIRDVLKFLLADPQSRKIAFFLAVNLSFMLVELLYGIWNNSLGLIADSFHMFFDSSALAIGLYAAFVSKWKPNQTYSYGYGRFEVLSGYVNGVMLVFVAFFVFLKAVERVVDPPHIHDDRLMAVSVGGFLINMVGIFAFHSHHDHDHNTHGMFLHILADTIGSVGVMISSYLITNYGLLIADPICSLIISVLIFTSALPLVRHSARILMQCTPDHMKGRIDAALTEMKRVAGVVSYSEPHFWNYSGPLMVGTVHVQIADEASEQEVLNECTRILMEKRISYTCVQVEKVGSSN